MICNQVKSTLLILGLAVLLVVGLAPQAFAQDSDDATEDSSEEMEGDDADEAEFSEVIVVTGTRTEGRSVVESIVPIDVITADDFANQGDTDISTLLRTLAPSYNVNTQPISDAATVVRPANLRNLAPDHTLVLVNGKRRHRAAVIAWLGNGVADGAQGADISVIPSIALRQVEVLRDGASAQYGSDAIAGVINFLLKDSSQGGSIEVRTGEYSEGDGSAVSVAGNVGLPLGENGFLNLSLEYGSSDATDRSVQRDDAAALTAALRENGVFTDLFGVHQKRTSLVHGSADHSIFNSLFNRNWLTGDHGFVYCALALDDGSIHRNLLAGAYSQRVALLDMFQWHFSFLAIANYGCSGWGKREQFTNRSTGTPSGTQFQNLSQQHERRDHRRCLEVNLNGSGFSERFRDQAGKQQGEATIKVSRTDAESDKREHVEVPSDDTTPATFKEWPSSPKHDGSAEYELRPPRHAWHNPLI